MAASADINISATSSYSKAAPLANFTGGPKIVVAKSLATTDISYVYDALQTATTGATTYNVLALTDDFGAAISMATVKGFVIYNTHATANLVVGGGSQPLFGTDQYTVKPGACLPITSPFSATTGVAQNIKVTPSASATWQLLLLGN